MVRNQSCSWWKYKDIIEEEFIYDGNTAVGYVVLVDDDDDVLQ